MNEATTPAELYRRGIELLLAGDLDGWLALCAEDVVFEFPFAPADRPKRVAGRAALAEYMRTYPGQVADPQVTSLRVHQTTDAQVAIAELTMRGTHRPTGTRRQSSYIAVVTVDGGLITHYRDYWNPLGGTKASDAAVENPRGVA